ncbi:unnamed protein product [Urochloa humidicola]
MKSYAGSKKEEKERARSMMNNLKLDEKKAHAESKKQKTKKNPVPCEFSVRPAGEGSKSKAGGGKRKKMVKVRLDQEYIDYLAGTPPFPLFQPFPSLDPGFIKLQESFLAKQKADLEQRDKILKQYADLGYADIEIEVADEEN